MQRLDGGEEEPIRGIAEFKPKGGLVSTDTVRVKGLGLGLDMFFDTSSLRGSNSVDGVCDFETVPPDQFCPSAKSD